MHIARPGEAVTCLPSTHWLITVTAHFHKLDPSMSKTDFFFFYEEGVTLSYDKILGEPTYSSGNDSTIWLQGKKGLAGSMTSPKNPCQFASFSKVAFIFVQTPYLAVPTRLKLLDTRPGSNATILGPLTYRVYGERGSTAQVLRLLCHSKSC